ncbi:VOC family protein [Trichocoleus sp. FACHB-262]|uniref:VOC family protein n=1 Tax=Trichocoleus sp. FACHB-262 TaxID=2692869 RepID=UPI0028C50BE5|nr:VOC family protein [Trichocoleus sp. FACHB-262]
MQRLVRFNFLRKRVGWVDDKKMMRCQTAWVTIAATDFDRLLEFYRQFLQQDPQLLLPNAYAEFRLPGLKLGIFKPKTSHQPEFQAPEHSAMSLCLEVEDLDTAISHLEAIAAPPSGQIIVATHGREIYAYDPEGNRLILHQTI